MIANFTTVLKALNYYEEKKLFQILPLSANLVFSSQPVSVWGVLKEIRSVRLLR